MKLIPNWRDVLRWAWSVRLGILAGLLSGVELVLPLFSETFPRGVFGLLSFCATVAATVARFVAQKGITK